MQVISKRKQEETSLRLLEMSQAALVPQLKDSDRKSFFRKLEISIKNKQNEEDLKPEQKRQAIEKLKNLKLFKTKNGV